MRQAAARARSIDPIAALVREHLKLKDEPLHLAIRFDDPRRPRELGLFEVIGGFGNGHIDPDKKFFEIAMESPAAADLAPGTELRLVLTSPEELREAHAKKWPALATLKKKLAGQPVMHASPEGAALKKILQPAR